jgi:hypothetical protein
MDDEVKICGYCGNLVEPEDYVCKVCGTANHE